MTLQRERGNPDGLPAQEADAHQRLRLEQLRGRGRRKLRRGQLPRHRRSLRARGRRRPAQPQRHPAHVDVRAVEGGLRGVGLREYVDPPLVKLNEHDLVSQPSSLRAEDGRTRLLLAADLRHATEGRRVEYVRARAANVVRDGDGAATGVRGVRMSNDGEYGGCVLWKANLAVVLAGGVFNSFDLLVESGIGPAEALRTRKVPESWWTPNERVGKGVGDEHSVVFLGVEPDAADPFGAQPRLIAEDTHASAYEFWTKGLLTWLRFRNTRNNWRVGHLLKNGIPSAYKLLDFLLSGCSIWAVGIDGGDPLIEVEAIPKPGNTTFLPFYPPAAERYTRYPFQSPITLAIESWWYKVGYKIGVIVDDTKIEVTDDMCEAIADAMVPMHEGGKRQSAVKAGFKVSARRFSVWLLTKVGFFRHVLRPTPATLANVEGFTGKGENRGKRCRTNMLASYYHYYGGNADVVDESFRVKGAGGLYVSDASVVARMTPGPSSSTTMQTGMRVADAFVASLADAGDASD